MKIVTLNVTMYILTNFTVRHLMRGVTFHSLLVVKLLVTRCEIRSLLVAEVARCKKTPVTR